MNRTKKSERDVLRDLEQLRKRHALTYAELQERLARSMSKEELRLPITIFTTSLTPLETIVKYLRENIGMRFSEMASIIGRDQRGLSITYRRASQKVSEQLIVTPSLYTFPLHLLKERDLSVAEHLVAHLQRESLSFHEIAALLKRDDRTIWTLAKRGEAKRD